MVGIVDRFATVSENLIQWRDEDHLWEWMLPNLLGSWRKLEAITPDGLPDSFGLYHRSTIWLEHKIGRPSIDAIRPKQKEFGLDCMKRSVPYFVAFGYQGVIRFYDDFSFSRPVAPRWWRPFAMMPPTGKGSRLAGRNGSAS